MIMRGPLSSQVVDAREQARLSELKRCGILNTLPEQTYDDIVALAARCCEVPIALISLVDEQRQWFKAKVGLQASETAREHAFCAHAIEQDEPLVVCDARDDSRFRDNPLVTGAPGIRFYAGVQLRTPGGAALGTLCVIDQVARTLTPEQLTALKALAREVSAHIELRRVVQELVATADERDRHAELAQERERRLEHALTSSQAGTYDWDVRDNTVQFSDRWKEILGHTGGEIASHVSEWTSRLHPDERTAVLAWGAAGLEHANLPFQRDYRLRHKEGHYVWISANAITLHDERGVPLRCLGVIIDITRRVAADNALREANTNLQNILDRVVALTGIMTLSGMLTRVNEVAVKAAGLQPNYGVGQHVADTYWFSYSKALQAQIRDAVRMAAAGEDVRFDCEIRVGDDRFMSLDFAIRPVPDRAGNVEYLIASAVDITTRKLAEATLYREKELAQITLRAIGDGVITTDANGIVDTINPMAEELTGFLNGTGLGEPIDRVCKIYSKSSGKPIENPVNVCLRTGELVILDDDDAVLLRPNDTEIALNDSAAPIKLRDGTVAGAVLIFRDVSEKRRLAAEVLQQASYDSLTQLLNRHEFERRLELMLKSAIEHDVIHALCFMDLDQFKVVNDTCGHAAGDALLTQLSAMLKTQIRHGDTLARLGGDEFGLLLGECPVERAFEIAVGLKDRIREFRFIWEDRIFTIGASIGLTPVTKHSGSAAAIMSAADSACYAAKEKGRNQVQVYETDDQELAEYQGEMRWVNRLHEAMAEGRLRLYYQDIVPLDSSRPSPLRREVLLRLVERDGALVLPGSFLPAAERYGQIDLIDRWVFDQVCSILTNSDGNEGFICHINVSGRSISQSQFVEYVLSQLSEATFNLGRLCFEITETAAISNLHAAQIFMAAVRARGCTIALDDFGSGLSSFSYLKNLPVDVLKIDGCFVRDMATDPIDCAMVEAIHRIGTLMGISTVAEHVENDLTLAILKRLGIQYAQGFGLSRPAPFPVDTGNVDRAANGQRSGIDDG